MSRFCRRAEAAGSHEAVCEQMQAVMCSGLGQADKHSNPRTQAYLAESGKLAVQSTDVL